mmetsp:Transcript_2922/g.4287  ORF Transcript_2922/g.4287 Transcript_2922/m.4287 type:complete len:419 (+) Transcript_2922:47-1303(+)
METFPARRLAPHLTTPKPKSTTVQRTVKHRVHTNKTGKGVKWTAEDDECLRRAVKKHAEKNWKAIAQDGFKGAKSDVQCLHRWRKVLDPSIKKGPWTPIEDELIFKGITLYGEGKWSKVAKDIPGRLGKQCRERWMNHLDPKIRKDPFTEEEDELIIELHAIYGTQWTKIRKDLPGRTDNAIKNRFYSHLKKKTKTVTPRDNKRASSKPRVRKQNPAKKRKVNNEIQCETRPLKLVKLPELPDSLLPLQSIIKVQQNQQTSSSDRLNKNPDLAPNNLQEKRIANQTSSSEGVVDKENCDPGMPSAMKRQMDKLFSGHLLSPVGKGEHKAKTISFTPTSSMSSLASPQFSPGWAPSPATDFGIASRTPWEEKVKMFTSPRPKTPSCREKLPSDVSSPCPRLTPLRDGKNLLEMMDAVES